MLLSWSMIMDSLRRMPWNAHVGSNTSRTGDCWMPIPSTCLPSRMPPCQTQSLLEEQEQCEEGVASSSSRKRKECEPGLEEN